jgi:hypothetical protein
MAGMSDGVISIVNSDEAALRIIVRQQRKEIDELKAAKGLVVAMIQTDANGKVDGIRHQEEDTFPPDSLIPLYLAPQSALRIAERKALEYVCSTVMPDGSREGDDALYALQGLLKRLG